MTTEMQIPDTLPEDHRSGAKLITEAVARVGGALQWQQIGPKGARKWTALVTVDEYEVLVEPCAEKYGTRIEGSNGREYFFTDVDKLATAIRGRAKRDKDADIRYEQERQETIRRNELARQCEKAAQAELERAFNPALIDACTYIRHHWPEGGDAPVAHVTVFCGRGIRGDGLSVAAASRFIGALVSAGYDLLNSEET